MNKEQLIAKQQLEIENLRLRLKWASKDKLDIVMRLTCIGGALNDNFLQYNREQLSSLQTILEIAENTDHELIED